MHILAAVDGSSNDSSLNAIIRTAKFLGEKLNAKITLFSVMLPISYLPYPDALSFDYVNFDTIKKIEDQKKYMLEEKLKALCDYLKPLDVSYEIEINSPPSEIILDKANSLNADLILIGTHDKGIIEEIFVGSVAESVVKNSNIPVLAVKSYGIEKLENVLICYDFSEHSDKALDYFKDNFKSKDMYCKVVYVDEGLSVSLAPFVKEPIDQEIDKRKREILEEKINSLKAFFKDISYEIVKSNDVSQAICDMSNEFDMVFLGSRSKGLLKRIFMGNTSFKIFKCSKVSTFIFKDIKN